MPKLPEMPETTASLIQRARAFLGGKQLLFADANSLWKALKGRDELSIARQVLERLRGESQALLDRIPPAEHYRLCQQEALLTSKDVELPAAFRHDRALEILETRFVLFDESSTSLLDVETLGIAGGILKRRWADLGNPDDLRQAGRLYERAAAGPVGHDGYAQINAAFVEDVLAGTGDDPVARRQRATAYRTRLLDELPPEADVPENVRWFNAATRAEAMVGLRRYRDAAGVIRAAASRPEPWELETTARQMAALVHLQEDHAWESSDVRDVLDALLPGNSDAARSVVVGKVGLALSGGGFRASFYHLGLLARLAELNVLRHVDVLSCVSGGSIVGTCYWLMLRQRLQESAVLSRADYVDLVRQLIRHFVDGVNTGVREQVQDGLFAVLLRAGRKVGALDGEKTAATLEEVFYRPLMKGSGPVFMHDLPFAPKGFTPSPETPSFQPARQNWMRADKVPAFVLNATTVNTGHAWQFTPTWMGESPWAVHDAADSVPRLEWAHYQSGLWEMRLGRAVAASACVPGVFTPLHLDVRPPAYPEIDVHFVDGGVHDNQGTVSLLAHDCNVLIVSDACGQLPFERQLPTGVTALLSFANRSLSTVMERVRLAGFADLVARRRAGRLRGLMFVHMKAGLDADPLRLRFSQESYTLRRTPLSPSGVRKDFQQALAELRTDLNEFTTVESHGLMACGYQMAKSSFAKEFQAQRALWDAGPDEAWPFAEMLDEITSTAPTTPGRESLLAALRAGQKVAAF